MNLEVYATDLGAYLVSGSWGFYPGYAVRVEDIPARGLSAEALGPVHSLLASGIWLTDEQYQLVADSLGLPSSTTSNTFKGGVRSDRPGKGIAAKESPHSIGFTRRFDELRRKMV